MPRRGYLNWTSNSTLNQNQEIDFPPAARVARDVTGAYIAGFIFTTIDQDRNGLIHTRIGNKIASSPLIGTTTSASSRSPSIGFHFAGRRALKGTFARMSNKRGAIEAGGKARGNPEDWNRTRFGVASSRRRRRREELNKCLPAEICVPIFEAPEFPRTAK